MKLVERNGLRILTSDFGHLIHNKENDIYAEKFYLGINSNVNDFEEVANSNIDEKLTTKITEIDKENLMQNELIDISLLATDEMYMMIEPLLEAIVINERGVSKMVDMYVAMIIRGLKTIDEVPLRYREEVRLILEQLEK
jgi:hypothetical protein